MLSPRFLRFLFVSGIAAVANIGSRILFSVWLPYVPSIVLAYLVGLCSAFVLNRVFVFRESRNPVHHQAFWFTVVNLAAVLQTLAVSVLLAEFVFPRIGFHWHGETLAHAAGVAAPAVTSYLGHKYLTFR